MFYNAGESCLITGAMVWLLFISVSVMFKQLVYIKQELPTRFRPSPCVCIVMFYLKRRPWWYFWWHRLLGFIDYRHVSNW